MPENATDFRFRADAGKCTGCGECAADCVAEAIVMENGAPVPRSDGRKTCIGCQHCLAVCPAGAASVLGRDPALSRSLGEGALPAPESLEALIMGRRSIRRFKPEAVERAVLDRLLAAAAYAPTGVNDRRRRFAVIADPAAMARFRDRAFRALEKAGRERRIPERYAAMEKMPEAWFQRGKDHIFRNAPHLIAVSIPKNAPCPAADGVIALSYFEIMAQTLGVGTVWVGRVQSLLEHVAPELKADLGVPEDHLLSYCMVFGMPAVRYPRSVQRKPEDAALLFSLP